MKFIFPLAVAIIFIACGIVSIFSPSTIKNIMNRSHMSGLKDFGASDNQAKQYVEKYVEQRNWLHRVMGVIMVFFGSALFYAVVRTIFSS